MRPAPGGVKVGTVPDLARACERPARCAGAKRVRQSLRRGALAGMGLRCGRTAATGLSGAGSAQAVWTDRSPWDWYAPSCPCGLPPERERELADVALAAFEAVEHLIQHVGELAIELHKDPPARTRLAAGTGRSSDVEPKAYL